MNRGWIKKSIHPSLQSYISKYMISLHKGIPGQRQLEVVIYLWTQLQCCRSGLRWQDPNPKTERKSDLTLDVYIYITRVADWGTKYFQYTFYHFLELVNAPLRNKKKSITYCNRAQREKEYFFMQVKSIKLNIVREITWPKPKEI